MKKIFLLTAVCIGAVSAHAQFIYKIKADSVLITNDSCTAELNLENSTKHIKGFLFNKGNGRTEFRRGLIRLNDSTDIYIIGEDTLDLTGFSGGASNIIARDGLIRINDTLYLGNTVSGSGIHNLSANRYQYLNGNFYSFGGTKFDSDTRPVLRLHDNGDVTFSANNNYSVVPPDKSGMRFIAKKGLLQIGLSDQIDTTLSGYFTQLSGILINSDTYGNIKGQIKGSVVAAYDLQLDTTASIYYSLMNGHSFY